MSAEDRQREGAESALRTALGELSEARDRLAALEARAVEAERCLRVRDEQLTVARQATRDAEIQRDIARGLVGAVKDGSAEWESRALAAEAEVGRLRDDIQRIRILASNCNPMKSELVVRSLDAIDGLCRSALAGGKGESR